MKKYKLISHNFFFIIFSSWTLESKYNLLWGFNTAEMRVQSITNCIPISEKKFETNIIVNNDLGEFLNETKFLRAPEFIIPIKNETKLSMKQVALNFFGITYAATLLESKQLAGPKVPFKLSFFFF